MQVSIYYCLIQSPDSVLHALQTQQSRSESMYASWPLTCGVLGLFQSMSFPSTNTARIGVLLSFLSSNTDEIAATPWMGVRTTSCFAALPRNICSSKHVLFQAEQWFWSYILVWDLLLLLFQYQGLYSFTVVYFYHCFSLIKAITSTFKSAFRCPETIPAVALLLPRHSISLPPSQHTLCSL